MAFCGPQHEWLCPNAFLFTDEENKVDPVEEAVIAVARELDPPSPTPPSPPPTPEFKQVSSGPTKKRSRAVTKMKYGGKVPYYAMVFLAFRNAGDQYIDVQQLYAFVMHVFPQFKDNAREGWRSALRHQLAKYSDSFTKYKDGRKMRYQLIQGETSMHRKFDIFCSKVDPRDFVLAEYCFWEDVKEGRIGIPAVQLKTPTKKEKAKIKEEEKEAQRIQMENVDLAVVNILKEYNMEEEAAVKIECPPYNWEMHQAPAWDFGDALTAAWNFEEDITAAWEQYQQQIYCQNYFYYNPTTFDGYMFY